MMWAANASGSIVFIEPDWERFTGQPVEQAQGKGWLEKIHPQDRETVIVAFDRARNDREQFIIRYRLAQRGGGSAWVVASATPSIIPATGAFVGFLGTLEVLEENTHETNAEIHIGCLRPPSEVLDGAYPTPLEGLADQVIYARTLAEKAEEKMVMTALDVALLEIGRRLVEEEQGKGTAPPEHTPRLM